MTGTDEYNLDAETILKIPYIKKGFSQDQATAEDVYAEYFQQLEPYVVLNKHALYEAVASAYCTTNVQNRAKSSRCFVWHLFKLLQNKALRLFFRTAFLVAAMPRWDFHKIYKITMILLLLNPAKS